MSKITSEVVNTVTMTDELNLSETFIFSHQNPALQGVHTAYLLGLAYQALEQEHRVREQYKCSQPSGDSTIGIGLYDSKIIFAEPVGEYLWDLNQVLTYILLPFDLAIPDLVPHISEHNYEHQGIQCWFLEDLTGYYSGRDSDIWILTDSGLLIATEEIGSNNPVLEPVAVFQLGKVWTEEEVKTSEVIKSIIEAANE